MSATRSRKVPTSGHSRKRSVDLTFAKALIASEPPRDSNLDHLESGFREKLQRTLQILAAKGKHFRFHEGFRTTDRQLWLFGLGRPNAQPYGRPGDAVTDLDGVTKKSKHQGSGTPGSCKAADCYPYKDGDRDITEIPSASDPIWKAYAEEAQRQGLRAGLYFSQLVDAPHVEDSESVGFSTGSSRTFHAQINNASAGSTLEAYLAQQMAVGGVRLGTARLGFGLDLQDLERTQKNKIASDKWILAADKSEVKPGPSGYSYTTISTVNEHALESVGTIDTNAMMSIVSTKFSAAYSSAVSTELFSRENSVFVIAHAWCYHGREPLKLDDQELSRSAAQVKNDPKAFVGDFGSHFVGAVHYASSVSVVFTVTSSDTSARTKVASRLHATGSSLFGNADFTRSWNEEERTALSSCTVTHKVEHFCKHDIGGVESGKSESRKPVPIPAGDDLQSFSKVAKELVQYICEPDRGLQVAFEPFSVRQIGVQIGDVDLLEWTTLRQKLQWLYSRWAQLNSRHLHLLELIAQDFGADDKSHRDVIQTLAAASERCQTQFAERTKSLSKANIEPTTADLEELWKVSIGEEWAKKLGVEEGGYDYRELQSLPNVRKAFGSCPLRLQLGFDSVVNGKWNGPPSGLDFTQSWEVGFDVFVDSTQVGRLAVQTLRPEPWGQGRPAEFKNIGARIVVDLKSGFQALRLRPFFITSKPTHPIGEGMWKDTVLTKSELVKCLLHEGRIAMDFVTWWYGPSCTIEPCNYIVTVKSI